MANGPANKAILEQEPKSTAPSPLEIVLQTAERGDGYLLKELPSFAVQQLIGIHEEFLAGVVRAWLLAKPNHLIREQRPDERKPVQRTIEFRRILTTTREELIAEAVEREVADFARKGITDQHARLFDLIKADAGALEIDRLAELAATRNALVHADGVAGPDYFLKPAVSPASTRSGSGSDSRTIIWRAHSTFSAGRSRPSPRPPAAKPAAPPPGADAVPPPGAPRRVTPAGGITSAGRGSRAGPGSSRGTPALRCTRSARPPGGP